MTASRTVGIYVRLSEVRAARIQMRPPLQGEGRGSRPSAPTNKPVAEQELRWTDRVGNVGRPVCPCSTPPLSRRGKIRQMRLPSGLDRIRTRRKGSTRASRQTDLGSANKVEGSCRYVASITWEQKSEAAEMLLLRKTSEADEALRR